MRLLAVPAAALLVLGACGGAATAPSPSPTVAPTPTPAPSPTPQTKFAFLADLKTTNEVPPVSNAEASCAGKGTFTLDTTKDSTGKITAATAQFDLTISGCPNTTEITLFHIHQAPAGQTGGVKVDSGQKAAEAIKLTTGATSGTVTKTGITVDAALATEIIATPANYYFNVHSRINPGGVVRGQLTKG